MDNVAQICSEIFLKVAQFSTGINTRPVYTKFGTPSTPEQANMPLIYTPYVPSLWEDFILRNRRILADQMEFLMAHVPKSSRLLV